jgi:hypothetical protein
VRVGGIRSAGSGGARQDPQCPVKLNEHGIEWACATRKSSWAGTGRGRGHENS